MKHENSPALLLSKCPEALSSMVIWLQNDVVCHQQPVGWNPQNNKQQVSCSMQYHTVVHWLTEMRLWAIEFRRWMADTSDEETAALVALLLVLELERKLLYNFLKGSDADKTKKTICIFFNFFFKCVQSIAVV